MNIHCVYDAVTPLFRKRRMRQFIEALAPRQGETALDLGGTRGFWTASGVESEITLVNIEGPGDPVASPPHVTYRQCDACALPFRDFSFDIVFSNSAIEHVGTWERQQAFAREALRVGRRVWVQTPAREFFIEPHLIAPFVHWLPRRLQRQLIRNFTVRGWFERPDQVTVDAFLDEVRLLTLAEMRVLFPGCQILKERFLGMVKSYIAVRKR